MKLFFLMVLLFPFLFLSCRKNDNEQPEKTLTRKFNSFIFVGNINGKPGLYKYSSAAKSYSEFWNNKEGEVVEYSYSDNQSSAFFLTAGNTGTEGIFPFIKNAKLYVITDSTSQPKFIRDIGSGLQVFSRWESEIVFRIVINSWDRKNSTFINQTTIIFNTYGKVLQEVNKIYDITKDGYPRLPKLKPDFVSPSGEYQLAFRDSKPDSVFLIRTKDKDSSFVALLDKPLNDISWSDDRKFIFISTIEMNPADGGIFPRKPNTSSLYIYSFDQKKIIKEFTGGGYKNFFTINDFLIFDDGFGKNSSVYIYNFKENKTIKQIRIKNGCGLRDIPEIPGFGA